MKELIPFYNSQCAIMVFISCSLMETGQTLLEYKMRYESYSYIICCSTVKKEWLV